MNATGSVCINVFKGRRVTGLSRVVTDASATVKEMSFKRLITYRNEDEDSICRHEQITKLMLCSEEECY